MNATPLPPGVQRRKQLRQEKRADRLRHLWRTTIFIALAGGLGYVLVREGWILRDPTQVEVAGSTKVGREQVIAAAGMRFPQPLLQLNPNEVARRLSGSLPVDQVRVKRLMLPPRLQVDLIDRRAVARAQRRTPQGLEKGYIDRQGRWIRIPVGHDIAIEEGGSDLLVAGWQERHEATLAKVLDHLDSIGPGLREIRFENDGSLWLRTRELGSIRLGPLDERLERRLEVVAHLRDTLPTTIRGRRPRLIDLTDPEQPELSLSDSRPEKPSSMNPANPRPD